ncbi:H-NS histone family protein, partial [Caballeronia arationis]|uniref:H-NS histone family protein n=1 Tax=Caballeronia arationis TaxID=1777142 RepID=UPI000B359348
MATLEQIKEKMKKLQTQADALTAKRSRAILDDIHALMAQHNLTSADIEAHQKSSARKGRPRGALSQKSGQTSTQTSSKSSSAAKGKLPAKYRNPKTGQTWSGWARPPAWIAKVRDRTKFLIDGSSAETTATSTTTNGATDGASTKRLASQPAAKKRASVKASASSTSAPASSVAATKKSSTT